LTITRGTGPFGVSWPLAKNDETVHLLHAENVEGMSQWTGHGALPGRQSGVSCIRSPWAKKLEMAHACLGEGWRETDCRMEHPES
jgi:hypothetical protein